MRKKSLKYLYKSNKKLSSLFSKVSKLLLIGCLFSSPIIAIPLNTSSLIRDNPKEVLDEVWQIIYREFLDSSGSYKPSEWISLRKELLSSKYENAIDSHNAIRNMLSGLNDPYTRFLDPKEFLEMRIDTSGELMGVGIQISSNNNEIIVIAPIEGTPAFKAGIKPNDVIISIDNKSTEGMSIDKAVKLIRGKKGTRVDLGLLRENKLINISLVRERIEINVVDSRLNKSDYGIDIGYIRLKQFNANSAKEMSDSIKYLEAENVAGYVLDLRSNPGGLLESSVEIARQWIDQGVIVSTQTKDGIKDVRRANGTALTSRPLVILVNEGSASASEILSGAIQDNTRGILVGKTTFGKGLVQSVRALSDGSGLTVTIAKYLTPKGKDINKYGIKPDIKADILIKDGIKLQIDDLATNKDSQYIIAETALFKKIADQKRNTSYRINNPNLKYALIN
tara:strand:- start:10292 stop:11644 length:1353 start_codon:yes stop_codon:yes gene_type:complete